MTDATFERERWYTSRYNISNAMRCPAKMAPKITSFSGPMGAIANNLDDYALAYPLSGMSILKKNFGDVHRGPKGPFYKGPDSALGSNYFVKMGTCKGGGECAGKDRYVYIRNIPSSEGMSFHSFTGCDMKGLTEMRGLLPGMVQDIADIVSLGDAATGKKGSFGSDQCQVVRQPVGTNINDSEMRCAPGTGPHGNLTLAEKEKCLYSSTTPGSWWVEARCSPQYGPASERFGTYNGTTRTRTRLSARHGWLALALAALMTCVVLAVYRCYRARN